MVLPRVDPRIYSLFLFILLLLVVALEDYLPNKYLYIVLIPVCYYQLIVICDYADYSRPAWLKWISFSSQNLVNREEQPLVTSQQKADEKYESCPLSTYDNETTSERSNSREKQIFESKHNQKNIKPDCRESPTKSVTIEDVDFTHNPQTINVHHSPQGSPNSLEPSSTTEFGITEKRSSLKNISGKEKAFDNKDKEKIRCHRSVTFNEKPTFTNTNCSEFTKSYYFPHRLKRLQSCLETTTDASRRYKVRHYSEKDSQYQVNLPTPSTSSEGSEEAFDCAENQNDLNEDYEQDRNDLTKSYSFPLRQRRQHRKTESSDGIDDDFDLPAMPLWDYRPSYLREKRRKSISTDALNRDLNSIDSKFQQKENDFCQSLELPREDSSSNNLGEKNTAMPLSNLNKIKQGILNRFKKSNKIVSYKQSSQNRKTFFKELFSSKENVNIGSAKKSKGDGYIPSKFMKKEHSPCLSSPTYVSYDNFSRFDENLSGNT